MATGMWEAMYVPARAVATLSADGKLVVGSATADIGTGTYTIMTQIAAETLGLPLEDVTFKLGDASLPYAYLEGGSSTAASVGTAVQQVCMQVKEELFSLARRLEATAYATTFTPPGGLEAQGQAVLGVLLDFLGIDRRTFLTSGGT